MGRRIATVGMFDGVHCGHRYLVEQMRSEAVCRGLETEVVTFATHPLLTIRPECVPPMLSLPSERVALLASIGVDHCRVLDFDADMQRLTAREFMAMLHEQDGVDVMILGFNNRFGSDRLCDIADYQRIGAEVGVEVLQAKEYPGVSSSVVRQQLAEHDVQGAAESLGRYYSISGTVVKGKQLGRTIGFPTANVAVGDKSKLVPPIGVYACVAVVGDGERYPAMVNIGRCPTVDANNNAVTIEANIIGFDSDIYSCEIEIEFVDYLRGEQRFGSLDELVAQLEFDRQRALDITASAL